MYIRQLKGVLGCVITRRGTLVARGASLRNLGLSIKLDSVHFSARRCRKPLAIYPTSAKSSAVALQREAKHCFASKYRGSELETRPQLDLHAPVFVTENMTYDSSAVTSISTHIYTMQDDLHWER